MVRGEDGTARVERVAREVFGLPGLRSEQERAIGAVLERRDALVVLPTGAGKSAIYEIAGVLLDGPVVVISPLIALQHDQLAALERTDAPPAVLLNSTRRAAELRRDWQRVRDGEAGYVYLTPEQLAREEVRADLAAARPALFVVDEAHCVSFWGHDFRPDYLRLGQAAEDLGRPPVLALTATAAPPVREDIVARLGMRDPVRVIAGFDRPNLDLAVRQFTDDAAKRAGVLEAVSEAATPALLYTATRKDTERYRDELARQGRKVAAYHAGLAAAERSRTHDDFMAGTLDVVVATAAFGMGVDKPDIRFVGHAAPPESVDSYYQEVGRAGRDGEPAGTLLCYRPEDLALQRFLNTHRPDDEALSRLARVLRDADGPLSVAELTRRSGKGRRAVTTLVELLGQAGAVTGEGRPRWADPRLPVRAAVELAVRAAEDRQRIEQSRIEMMRGYAEATGCRRQYLLAYFGEQREQPCGHCDNCRAGRGEAQPARADFPPNSRVSHQEWGSGVVLRRAPDRLTVLFDSVGYRTLSLTAIADQSLLTPASQAPPAHTGP